MAPGQEIVVDINGDFDRFSESSTSSWDSDGSWPDGASMTQTDSACETESELRGLPQSESTLA